MLHLVLSGQFQLKDIWWPQIEFEENYNGSQKRWYGREDPLTLTDTNKHFKACDGLFN